MSTRLVYSEKGHRYSLDGQRVPSVTTVAKAADDGRGLLRWSARMAAEWCADHRGDLDVMDTGAWVETATGAADRDRNAKGSTGTLVHTCAERLLYGEPLPAEDPETGEAMPEDVLAMAGQAARFLDAWQVEPVIHEALVFHDIDRWAGRLDLVADMGGERWLLDWKTAASGPWTTDAMQLAAYAHATHVSIAGRDMLMTPIQRGACVWLRPDHWELVPVAIGDSVYEAFRHAMHVLAWQRAKRDDLVGAPLPVPEVAS